VDPENLRGFPVDDELRFHGCFVESRVASESAGQRHLTALVPRRLNVWTTVAPSPDSRPHLVTGRWVEAAASRGTREVSNPSGVVADARGARRLVVNSRARRLQESQRYWHRRAGTCGPSCAGRSRTLAPGGGSVQKNVAASTSGQGVTSRAWNASFLNSTPVSRSSHIVPSPPR